MKGTKKNLAGPIIVIGIVILATLGAGLTWRNYNFQAPSTPQARTIDGNTIEAIFPAADAAKLQPGMKAIITIAAYPEKRFLGIVESSGSTNVRVRLKDAPPDLKPSLSAQVTVDTAAPVEQ